MDGASEILVLRAWNEPTSTPKLRVRVIRVTPGQAGHTVLVTTSVDEACAAVREWLLGLQLRERESGGS